MLNDVDFGNYGGLAARDLKPEAHNPSPKNGACFPALLAEVEACKP